MYSFIIFWRLTLPKHTEKKILPTAATMNIDSTTRTDNNNIIKMLPFHVTLNQRLGRKLPEVIETAITVDLRLENLIFLKMKSDPNSPDNECRVFLCKKKNNPIIKIIMILLLLKINCIYHFIF